MKKIILSLIVLSLVLGVAAVDQEVFEAEQDTEAIMAEFNSWEPNTLLLMGYEKINVELKFNKMIVRRYHVLIDESGRLTAVNPGNVNNVDFTVTVPLSIAKRWITDGPDLDYENDLGRIEFYPAEFKDEISLKAGELY